MQTLQQYSIVTSTWFIVGLVRELLCKDYRPEMATIPGGLYSLPPGQKITRQHRLKRCLVAFLSTHGLEWVV